jgi:riboflavin synthase
MGKARRKTEKSRYSFFAMEETFSKTNFWSKNIGNSFNGERSMIYGQRVDGHMVSWHIDTIASISEINENTDHSWNFSITLDAQRGSNMIEKGSIAINGVSLTIANIKKQATSHDILVTVCLIPYTREHTNLSRLSVWDIVNIEFDMMGKYILLRNS